MRPPWTFLLIIAAILAAYVWIFVWTGENAPEQAKPTPPLGTAG